jgi:hypothetical protein
MIKPLGIIAFCMITSLAEAATCPHRAPVSRYRIAATLSAAHPLGAGR